MPSLMPGYEGRPPFYVGSGAHAADVGILVQLVITVVLNFVPSVCRDLKTEYKKRGIAYLEIDARDNKELPLLESCLRAA